MTKPDKPKTPDEARALCERIERGLDQEIQERQAAFDAHLAARDRAIHAVLKDEEIPSILPEWNAYLESSNRVAVTEGALVTVRRAASGTTPATS